METTQQSFKMKETCQGTGLAHMGNWELDLLAIWFVAQMSSAGYTGFRPTKPAIAGSGLGYVHPEDSAFVIKNGECRDLLCDLSVHYRIVQQTGQSAISIWKVNMS
jgi:hypothetical protein